MRSAAYDSRACVCIVMRNVTSPRVLLAPGFGAQILKAGNRMGTVTIEHLKHNRCMHYPSEFGNAIHEVDPVDLASST
jgi:hypothetical protein